MSMPVPNDSNLGGAFGGSRRDFLKSAAAAGLAIGLPMALGGCHVLGAAGRRKLDFGDDFGVLNYAYALETLEADFYTAVVSRPPRDFTATSIEHGCPSGPGAPTSKASWSNPLPDDACRKALRASA